MHRRRHILRSAPRRRPAPFPQRRRTIPRPRSRRPLLRVRRHCFSLELTTPRRLRVHLRSVQADKLSARQRPLLRPPPLPSFRQPVRGHLPEPAAPVCHALPLLRQLFRRISLRAPAVLRHSQLRRVPPRRYLPDLSVQPFRPLRRRLSPLLSHTRPQVLSEAVGVVPAHKVRLPCPSVRTARPGLPARQLSRR